MSWIFVDAYIRLLSRIYVDAYIRLLSRIYVDAFIRVSVGYMLTHFEAICIQRWDFKNMIKLVK